MDNNYALLSETDWSILRVLKPVMEPFMTVQTLLEGEKYVTVSLLVLYISDLRDGLNHALDYLTMSTPEDDSMEIVAKAVVILCTEELEEFDKL